MSCIWILSSVIIYYIDQECNKRLHSNIIRLEITPIVLSSLARRWLPYFSSPVARVMRFTPARRVALLSGTDDQLFRTRPSVNLSSLISGALLPASLRTLRRRAVRLGEVRRWPGCQGGIDSTSEERSSEPRVSQVRQRLHCDQKPQAAPALRVRRDAEVQMPVLRHSQQAAGPREPAHTKETLRSTRLHHRFALMSCLRCFRARRRRTSLPGKRSSRSRRTISSLFRARCSCFSSFPAHVRVPSRRPRVASHRRRVRHIHHAPALYLIFMFGCNLLAC